MTSTAVATDRDATFPYAEWEPIPLTPFEAMIVEDERPGSSMSCAAEFHFDGAIQREPFEQAFESALSRHKLIRAVIRGHGKQQKWCPAERLPPLYWNHESAEEELAEMRPFDLSREPGNRCWVNVEGNRSTLRYDFHHACCDAIGGMGFIEDLFTIYDALIHKKQPILRPYDDQRLSLRDRITMPASWRAWIHRLRIDFKKSSRLLLNKPIILPAAPTSTPWSGRFIIRHLPEEDLVRLRYAASNASATLNDLLIVEFMCLLRDWAMGDEAIREWDREQLDQLPRERDHIRLIMPMNLRDREDLKLAAANKIGFSFLSRSIGNMRTADTDGWTAMMKGINAELEQAKRLRLPAQFLKKLAYARISQRLFTFFFSERRCWGTAVLTQLGDPTRRFYNRFPRKDGRILLGNLVLRDFVSCAPLRPMTRSILSTNAYGNELTLTMRCDPATIPQSTAESAMDEFVKRLKSRCKEQTPH